MLSKMIFPYKKTTSEDTCVSHAMHVGGSVIGIWMIEMSRQCLKGSFPFVMNC